MNRLTPAEEQVMLRLWVLERASVKQIVKLYNDNLLDRNSTSTIARVLERKNFIKHRQKGSVYIYKSMISRNEYREYLTEHLLANYCDQDKISLIEEIKRI